MVTHESTNSSSLIPAGARDLIPRSSVLVRRGLDDIARRSVTAERIDQLLAALRRIYRDPQACAEAAKSVIELGPVLDLRDDNVARLFWALVVCIRHEFETGRGTLTSLLGPDHPGKPSPELRQLLTRALESFVGPIGDSGDAVIAALKRGKLDTRIEAAAWLGKYEIQKAVGHLRNALDRSTDVVLTMLLRYALAWLALEDPDVVYREMVQHATTTSDDRLRDRCRYYLFDPPRWVSADTLGRCICLLAAHEDEQLASLVTYLLTYAFAPRGQTTPNMAPTIPLEHCSDPVLDAITKVAFQAFLRETGMTHRYEGVDATDPARVLQIANDWWRSTGHLFEQNGDKRQLVMLYRRLAQIVEDKDARARKERRGPQDRPPQESIDASHELAFAYLQRGQLHDAIQEYREILRRRPHDAWARMNLGQALRQTGRLDAAIREFREALAHGFASDSEAHYTLANTLWQRRLLDDAAVQFREALRLSPSLPDTHLKCSVNLGLVLQESGQLNAAIEELRRAASLAPDSTDAHYCLGHALMDNGQLDESIPELREALRLQPNHKLAFLSLASALAAKGLMDELGKLVHGFPR
jgi:tetratricopeptide (TPR) repeat protein